MSIQTTDLRPEDDPANWFTGTEVVGPAIVTAVIGGYWRLFDHVPAAGATLPRPLLEFNKLDVLHKFFVKEGHCLRLDLVNTPKGMISGYRFPLRT